MDGINTDFVGVQIDAGGSWSFFIPSDARRLSDCLSEFASISERLFDACEGFLQPVEVEYSVKRYSGDGPVSVLFDGGDRREAALLESDRHRIVDEDGVSEVPIQTHRIDGEEVACVGDIEFVRSRARIYLEEFDGWVDRGSNRIKTTRFGEVLSSDPTEDIFFLTVTHLKASQNPDLESGYHLSVGTYTDLWFEDTEIGEVNRRRLTDFFGRLVDSFEFVEIRVDSKRHSDDQLRTLVPD